MPFSPSTAIDVTPDPKLRNNDSDSDGDLPDQDMGNPDDQATVKKEFENKYDTQDAKKESEKLDRCPFLITNSFF